MIIPHGERRFLTCEEFKRFDEKAICCAHCHLEWPTDGQSLPLKKAIYFAPRASDGLNRDYSLGIEAIVCCTMYHVVAGLTRTEWEALSGARVEKPKPVTSASVRERKPRVKACGPSCLLCGEPTDGEEVCARCAPR